MDHLDKWGPSIQGLLEDKIRWYPTGDGSLMLWVVTARSYGSSTWSFIEAKAKNQAIQHYLNVPNAESIRLWIVDASQLNTNKNGALGFARFFTIK